MKRSIRIKEKGSFGKKGTENNDYIYAGQNYAAVIDDVSNKAPITENNNKIEIAEIIVQAIKNLERPNAPMYAKSLGFHEFVSYVNEYISKFYIKHDLFQKPDEKNKLLEATGVIYSKYRNQVWLVGDCRALCDGEMIENPLAIDMVYNDMRDIVVDLLLSEGYSKKTIKAEDIAKKIIENMDIIPQYIKNTEQAQWLACQMQDIIKKALLDAGFTEKQISQEGLIDEYKNIRKLQQYAKNNPNAGKFGYAVFNGEYTEAKNCKIVDLPEHVKEIRLFSDEFPVNTFSNTKIGKALKYLKKRAAKNRLDI